MTMKVQIIEGEDLIKFEREDVELEGMQELGTALSYGLNDTIKGRVLSRILSLG